MPTLLVVHLFPVISISPHYLASSLIFCISFIQVGWISDSWNITHISLFSPSLDITSIIKTHSWFVMVEQKNNLFSICIITFSLDVNPNALPFSFILYVSLFSILYVLCKWRYKSNHSKNISSIQFCTRFSSIGWLYLVWILGWHWKKFRCHFSENGLVFPCLKRNFVAIFQRCGMHDGHLQAKNWLIQLIKTVFSSAWSHCKDSTPNAQLWVPLNWSYNIDSKIL